MKAKITFQKSLYDDRSVSVTVYGQSRKDLLDVAYALEKNENCIVSNLFITDDEVKEKVES